MLSDRYYISDDCDFSHVIPELASELRCVQEALEKSVIHEFDWDRESMLGFSLVLGRVARDFDWINKKLISLSDATVSEERGSTISADEG